MSFYFAVDLSPMFPDTLMVGMEIRLKVRKSCSSYEIELSWSFILKCLLVLSNVIAALSVCITCNNSYQKEQN